MNTAIKYVETNWRYVLTEDVTVGVGILGFMVDTKFLILNREGSLTIKSGYAWDGCSGPVLQTDDTVRASLAHDALYQIMRLGFLPIECRALADKVFHRMLLEDGMTAIRAWYLYAGVKMFGKKFASKLTEADSVR